MWWGHLEPDWDSGEQRCREVEEWQAILKTGSLESFKFQYMLWNAGVSSWLWHLSLELGTVPWPPTQMLIGNL